MERRFWTLVTSAGRRFRLRRPEAKLARIQAELVRRRLTPYNVPMHCPGPELSDSDVQTLRLHAPTIAIRAKVEHSSALEFKNLSKLVHLQIPHGIFLPTVPSLPALHELRIIRLEAVDVVRIANCFAQSLESLVFDTIAAPTSTQDLPVLLPHLHTIRCNSRAMSSLYLADYFSAQTPIETIAVHASILIDNNAFMRDLKRFTASQHRQSLKRIHFFRACGYLHFSDATDTAACASERLGVHEQDFWRWYAPHRQWINDNGIDVTVDFRHGPDEYLETDE